MKKQKRNLKRLAASVLAGILALGVFSSTALAGVTDDGSVSYEAPEAALLSEAADGSDESGGSGAGIADAVMEILDTDVDTADTSGSCGDNLTWSYDSDTTTLTITGYGSMTTYTGTSSSNRAPWYSDYRTEITKVVIDCTDTSTGVNIGAYAFYNCTALTEADLSNVKYIYNFAFQKCSSLEKVTVSENLLYIGNGAFYSCSSLKTMVTPEYGETTGTVYIPASVNVIGTQAFYSAGLSSITFLGTDVSFSDASKGTEAQFYKCASLTEVTLPSALTEITPYLFYYCTALESITFPETVTTIDKYAFTGSGLTSVTIPAGVSTLGVYVFQNCTALAEVNFAEDSALTAIENYTFANTSIEEIVLPDGIGTVGQYVFQSCTALTSVTFGTGLWKIGYRAFYNNTSELELHFTGDYDTVTSFTTTGEPSSAADGTLYIHESGFYGITAVAYYPADSETWPETAAVADEMSFGATSLVWAAEGDEDVTVTEWYSFDEETGTLYIYKNGKIPDYTVGTAPWYSDRASITQIVFGVNPEDADAEYTITAIGDYAFYGFTAINDITIPASVTSIGDHAFQGCAGTSITQVEDNGNFVVISGDGDITGLSSVTFEDGSQLTEIGESAFSGCCYLSSIVLPESLTEIGDYAFYECGTYANIAGLTYTLGSGDTTGASLSYSLLLGTYGSNAEVKEITVDGTTLTANEDYTYSASAGNNWLNSAVYFTESYLESLTAGTYSGSIQYENFMCPFTLTIYDADTEEESQDTDTAATTYYGLTSIDLQNVKSIGTGAFYGCCSLSEVTFGSALETIGNRAFYECESFTEISLPETLTEIGSYAFAGTSVQTISLHAGLTIGTRAFYSCTKLTEISFAEDDDTEATTLGTYVFAGCTALQEVTLPAGFTSVNEGLFSECSALTSVTLEGAVTAVGEDAFNGCSSLKTVTGLASVESVGDSAFYGCAALTDLELSEDLGNDDVGDFAFYRCAGLADENGFVVINGVLYAYVYSILGIDISDVMTGVGVGDSTDEIQDVTISAVTVPETVTEIANYAFYQIFATAGGTNSTVSTVTLEGIIFTCDADEVTFEELALAGLPLLSNNTATIGYPCSDREAWEEKLETYGLSGSGDSLGYRYDVAWNLTESVVHDYVDTVTTEPTCVEEGVLTSACQYCGESTTTAIAALGHEYDDGEVTTEATCTEEGVFTYTCTRDGCTEDTEGHYYTVELEALGHDYDDGVVTTEATCTEEGVLTYTCTRESCTDETDGHSYTESIEAIGHDYSQREITKEPTCTEDGVLTFTCVNCGDTITESIDATGHNYNDGEVTTKATCTEDGVITYTCANCGDTYTESIPATGHNYNDGEVTTEATCTEDGVITYTCANCGDTYTESIAATGHDYDEGVVTKEATCVTEGEITYTCANCGDTYTETIAALSETGTHTWDGDVCSVCGAEKDSIAGAAVTLSAVQYVYKGTACTPAVTVVYDGNVLTKDTDYTVTYVNNINAGTASVVIAGCGDYTGTQTLNFTIQKASQTLKVKAKKSKTVKLKKVKKKKQKVKVIKKVTGAKTKVTYKKVSGSKKIKVNKKTGKVTVKKGTKKGKYKVKIKVTAKATGNYKAASKTVTVKIKVK